MLPRGDDNSASRSVSLVTYALIALCVLLLYYQMRQSTLYTAQDLSEKTDAPRNHFSVSADHMVHYHQK
jgi:hypothetical protein